MPARLHVRRGGSGAGPVLLLAHGLGAHGGVWERMLGQADAWPGRWLAPDLRGHGASAWCDGYALADHAEDLAALARSEDAGDVIVLGHSMGGAAGLALASGRFGLQPRLVLGFGVKTDWNEAEAAWLSRLAETPPRRFSERDEAAERFLKASGLAGLVQADDAMVSAGLAAEEGGWRLAADPWTAAVGPPDMALLTAEASCRFHLASGEMDSMAPPAALRRWDPDAAALEGAGHNAMVEAPEVVWRWVRAACGLEA